MSPPAAACTAAARTIAAHMPIVLTAPPPTTHACRTFAVGIITNALVAFESARRWMPMWYTHLGRGAGFLFLAFLTLSPYWLRPYNFAVCILLALYGSLLIVLGLLGGCIPALRAAVPSAVPLLSGEGLPLFTQPAASSDYAGAKLAGIGGSSGRLAPSFSSVQEGRVYSAPAPQAHDPAAVAAAAAAATTSGQHAVPPLPTWLQERSPQYAFPPPAWRGGNYDPSTASAAVAAPAAVSSQPQPPAATLAAPAPPPPATLRAGPSVMTTSGNGAAVDGGAVAVHVQPGSRKSDAEESLQHLPLN